MSVTADIDPVLVPLFCEKETVWPPGAIRLLLASRAETVIVEVVPEAIVEELKATVELAAEIAPGVTCRVGNVFVIAAASMVAPKVLVLPDTSPVNVVE